MKTSTTLAVLRSVPEIEDIRHSWQSWPGNRDSELDTYLVSLRLSPNTVRPHVLVIYREGKAETVLVGRIDKSQISCKLGYLGIGLNARIMYFVYGALRGNASEENCEILVDEVMRSLSAGEADVAYLNFLRPDSSLCRLATGRPNILSREHVYSTQPHFAAKLPNTIDEFYQTLSPKVRKNQKWQAKKLLNHFSGAARIHCFREAAELETMIRDVEQIAKKSYQRGLGVGFSDSPEVRERLRLMAEKGWLRGYILYLAGRPAAFWVGDVNQGTFGSDYIGYDAEFASHSPGMYLVVKVIEGFCDGNPEGVTEVDFAQGHAQYKKVLGNQEWLESSIHIFAPTVKGVSLNFMRTLVGGADQTLKKALASTDLLQKVKKMWRTHLTPNEAIQS